MSERGGWSLVLHDRHLTQATLQNLTLTLLTSVTLMIHITLMIRTTYVTFDDWALVAVVLGRSPTL